MLDWDSNILSGFPSLLPILLQLSCSKLSALLKPWEGVSTSPPPQKNLLYSSISPLLIYISPYRLMPANMKPKFTPPLKYYRGNLCEWYSYIQKDMFFCFLNQEEVKSLSSVRLCDPMDCSLTGSSIHGIFQARVLEWGAIAFSRGSSRPRDWIQVSLIVGRRFTVWATREGIWYKPSQHNHKK